MIKVGPSSDGLLESLSVCPSTEAPDKNLLFKHLQLMCSTVATVSKDVSLQILIAFMLFPGCCRFKVYAPIAFRHFRDLFRIQPDDYLVSVALTNCDKEKL